MVNIEVAYFCVVNMFPKSSQHLWGLYSEYKSCMHTFCGKYCSLKVHNSHGVYLVNNEVA